MLLDAGNMEPGFSRELQTTEADLGVTVVVFVEARWVEELLEESKKNTNFFMNLKVLNWYDTLIGYDSLYDAMNVHRALPWL